MSAVAQLALGEPRQALVVPASAILDLAGVPVVYVQLGGETFEEHAVRTGTRDGDRIEILSGLAAGDRVVTVGAYQVRLASLSPDAAPAHSH
jgi:multidrug efflux pump subunit AcrA (membrane-fusion protein)